MQKLETETKEILHNITITVKGPSRITLLLSPLEKNVTFQMWGFEDVHLQIPDEMVLKDGKPYYFIQFVQGLQPRFVL